MGVQADEARGRPAAENEEALRAVAKIAKKGQDYAKLRPYEYDRIRELEAECRKFGARRRPCASSCHAHSAHT